MVKQIRRKLRDSSGASMLLAMVFLMFCLFVGGSVLAAATANAGRVESLKQDQQRYLSQRSALGLMADQLKGREESQLQLTIKDVKEGSKRTVTFTIHNEGETVTEKSLLQKLLYEFAVCQYAAKKAVSREAMRFENFQFTGDPVTGYVYPGSVKDTAGINLTAFLPGKGTAYAETLHGTYSFTETNDFQITLIAGDGAEESGEEAAEPAAEENGYISLTMNAYSGTGKTVTTLVDGVAITTTTTVIRWDDPVISKGGA